MWPYERPFDSSVKSTFRHYFRVKRTWTYALIAFCFARCLEVSICPLWYSLVLKCADLIIFFSDMTVSYGVRVYTAHENKRLLVKIFAIKRHFIFSKNTKCMDLFE